MVQSLNKLEIKMNVDWSRLCSSVSISFISFFLNAISFSCDIWFQQKPYK